VIEHVRVEPGEAARLASRDTRDDLGLPGKDESKEMRDDLIARIGGLQERLWAENRQSLLLVLQGMDTAGKDGTIRRVTTGVNPQGIRVAGFKAPSSNELDRDYLWRLHAVVPRRGEIGIFNRSQYEDIVTTQVLGIVDADHAARRMHHVVEWERMLADEGTTIVKVWLHISKDEQRERLQSRLDRPEKRWKFEVGDLKTRDQWDRYHELYEDAITTTSTAHAPWFVVPADRKWVRDVAVAQIVVDALSAMDPQIPQPAAGLDDIVVD
jgi:PPK2 family polyphosphate:nucleotide phosphotransferase